MTDATTRKTRKTRPCAGRSPRLMPASGPRAERLRCAMAAHDFGLHQAKGQGRNWALADRRRARIKARTMCRRQAMAQLGPL